MKKTLKTRKGLVPALLATLCSVGALTTVSYAWFTMGNQASVGEIEVDVQAADGMQISADAETWKTILPTEDLTTNGEKVKNHFPASDLKPVSSIGTVSAGVQSFFLGSVEDDGKISASSDTENFIKVDIYVKLDSNKKLSLDIGSYVKGTNDSNLSARVSFIDQGCVTNGVPADARALTGGNSSQIWEPNAEKHIAEVTNNGKTGKLAYVGVKSAITYTDGTFVPEGGEDTYENHFSSVTTLAPAYSNVLETTAAQELLDLEKGINKITVYMWLEGQDADCTNAVAAGSLKLGLKFSVPEAE